MRFTRKEFIRMAGTGLAGAAALEALPLFRKPEVFAAVPSQVPEDLAPVYAHLERNKTRHLANVQEFLRQPSVSATGEGMRECAEMVAGFLQNVGCGEVELIETDGHPVVWGKCDNGSSKTLVNYAMYDTQPIHHPEQWKSPPREARVIDMGELGQAVMARGAANTKGPLRAFFNALESILEVRGKLPVNLIFTVEGEEEQGSPHLKQALMKKESDLRKGTAAYFAIGQQDRNGEISLSLGVKGLAYMEFEASGARWGRGPKDRAIHGSNAAYVESPVWRLVDALATMTSENGMKIEMEGYYDKVAAPSDEDMELIQALLPRLDTDLWKKTFNVDRYYRDLGGMELLQRYFYNTTWNIDGIWGGWTGPGVATILPHQATAKIDSRLVPNQESSDIVPLARRHLDKHGYSDIEIRQLSAYEWQKTSPKDPIVEALVRVYRGFGINPMILPHLIGSAPFYLYSRTPFQMPFVMGGLGHGGNQHTVDEYFVVEGNGKIAGLTEVERSYVDFLYAYAAL